MKAETAMEFKLKSSQKVKKGPLPSKKLHLLFSLGLLSKKNKNVVTAINHIFMNVVMFSFC